jgi:squalene cyclase
MSDNMNRIQNADGSWTGHHCITGRTFCTSAALLVLMVDRSPVPVAAKIQRR